MGTVVIQRRQPADHAAPSHEVRLIGGRWKRSKLQVLDRPGLRPTPDRVRETLFNWLGQDLSGWLVLDAFAGSGALGFEAASRGAESVVLVERDGALVNNLRAAAHRLQADAVDVQSGDAMVWMQRAVGEPVRFDLVFLDPPFAINLFSAAMLAASRLLSPDGLIYLEADRAFSDDDLPAPLRVWRHARAGQVHYHLLRFGDAVETPRKTTD